MSEPLLAAIARALVAHCPHQHASSKQWHRDATAEWKVVLAPCGPCAELAAALGLESGRCQGSE